MTKYFLVISLFLGVNLAANGQSFQEVGLFDPFGSSLTNLGVKTLVGTTTETSKIKIYQSSANVLKYEIPSESYVKIGIYDKSHNLVRTYIYNNLKAGTYELNFTSGNLVKGSYSCVLSSGGLNESSVFNIE